MRSSSLRGLRGLLFIAPIALLSVLAGACGENDNNNKDGRVTAATGEAPIIASQDAQLAFGVWKCEDLQCLNLETLETSAQTYTACASRTEDAHEVGVEICEGLNSSSVVSHPARCEPLGTACPRAKLAYNWDDARRERDGGPPPDEAAADSGAP